MLRGKDPKRDSLIRGGGPIAAITSFLLYLVCGQRVECVHQHVER